MNNLIAVVNLVNGEELEREKDTLTLDFPPNFDRQTSGAACTRQYWRSVVKPLR